MPGPGPVAHFWGLLASAFTFEFCLVSCWGEVPGGTEHSVSTERGPERARRAVDPAGNLRAQAGDFCGAQGHVQPAMATDAGSRVTW